MNATETKHTPTLKLVLKEERDYVYDRQKYGVCLDDGTGLGAVLMTTYDKTIAEPIVKAVNAHEGLLDALKAITKQYSGDAKVDAAVMQDIAMQAIAKAEGRS